jgi:hypothetical protein
VDGGEKLDVEKMEQCTTEDLSVLLKWNRNIRLTLDHVHFYERLYMQAKVGYQKSRVAEGSYSYRYHPVVPTW